MLVARFTPSNIGRRRDVYIKSTAILSLKTIANSPTKISSQLFLGNALLALRIADNERVPVESNKTFLKGLFAGVFNRNFKCQWLENVNSLGI